MERGEVERPDLQRERAERKADREWVRRSGGWVGRGAIESVGRALFRIRVDSLRVRRSSNRPPPHDKVIPSSANISAMGAHGVAMPRLQQLGEYLLGLITRSVQASRVARALRA